MSRIAFLLLCGLLGCGSDATKPGPPASPYLPQSSPENVVENLQLAYRMRDSEGYSRLLHPEFIFVFQPVDVQAIGGEFWTRDQDTTQTKNLFEAISVTRIAIELTYGPATPTSVGSDTMFVRVNPTFLEVDELGEGGITTTYLVDGDIQDMFFVRGDGANSPQWYLIEWRDVPGGGSSALLRSPGVRPTTWGRIKSIKCKK